MAQIENKTWLANCLFRNRPCLIWDFRCVIIIRNKKQKQELINLGKEILKKFIAKFPEQNLFTEYMTFAQYSVFYDSHYFLNPYENPVFHDLVNRETYLARYYKNYMSSKPDIEKNWVMGGMCSLEYKVRMIYYNSKKRGDYAYPIKFAMAKEFFEEHLIYINSL